VKIITVTLHPAIDKVVQTNRIVPNEATRVQVKMVYGGGKGNNAARALTRLNVPVLATGFQGGHSGEYITSELEAEGILTDFIFCEAETRTSTLILEEETGNSYAIYEPGQYVQLEEANRLVYKVGELCNDASLILLCGSGQYQTLENVYVDIITMAKDKGIRCLLDSSGLSLKSGITAKPYMVKVNQHELSDYFKRPLQNLGDQIKALKDLQESGIAVAAVSRGANGLVVTDGKDTFEAKLTMERIINTVGAGDSLLAGIAKALVDGASMQEFARWGVACGTANTQLAGAGFITLELVNQFLPKVKIKKL
jgi:1-phosphofructokinase family hexose kinase